MTSKTQFICETAIFGMMPSVPAVAASCNMQLHSLVFLQGNSSQNVELHVTCTGEYIQLYVKCIETAGTSALLT